MKLNMLDRLIIPSVILPKKGSLVENIIANSIEENLKFTPEEIKKYKLSKDFSIEEMETSTEQEFSFTPEQLQLMKTGVNTLDESKAIPRYVNKTCLKIREALI